MPATAANDSQPSAPHGNHNIPGARVAAGATSEKHSSCGPAGAAYFIIRFCLWLLTHTVYRLRVCGAENLPKRGPALLVSNHVSFIDPFLIGACTRRVIRFLMDRGFYETAGIHWLAKLMGAIPIGGDDRPRKIVDSLREAQARLREGHLSGRLFASMLRMIAAVPLPDG